MMRRMIGFALLALLWLAATPGTAWAHRPAEASTEGITAIPSSTTSYAFYEELETPGEVQIYALEAEAGQQLQAGINIPQIEGLERFGVSLALLGPGLPELDPAQLPAANDGHTDHDHGGASLLEQLGLDAPSGLILASEETDPFYEPFTQTNYWGRQSIRIPAPASGTYYVVIWQPAGATGKFVLDTGYEEVFGPMDLFRFPVWWIQTHIYFGDWNWLGYGLGALLAIVAGVLLVRRARRSPGRMATAGSEA